MASTRQQREDQRAAHALKTELDKAVALKPKQDLLVAQIAEFISRPADVRNVLFQNDVVHVRYVARNDNDKATGIEDMYLDTGTIEGNQELARALNHFHSGRKRQFKLRPDHISHHAENIVNRVPHLAKA